VKLSEKNARPKKCEDCGGEFTAGKYARFCPVCRPLYRPPKRTKYVLDGETIALLRERYDGRVRNRAVEIARQLGWPKWAVNSAAIKLGLAAHKHKAWTPKEVAFIRQWAGLRDARWIAKQIGRSANGVGQKINRLDLSSRVTNGYSAREVGKCFGIDSHAVGAWVKRGWLHPAEHIAGRDGEDWFRFSDNTIRKFVQNHPLEFRLDKVDQVWFLGLILGSPALDEAAA